MEPEEQWSCRDFTQIKPRRPEGPAEEEWEEVEAPFSFLWSGGELEVEDERRDHDDEENESDTKSEEFQFSSVEEPAVVERLTSGSDISPADELFFKGQLLPLHLPPRIQMVKKLSSENQQQNGKGLPTSRNVHRNEEIIARVNALMQARFSRLFQPNKYSKFCMSSSDGSPGHSWWDPRESTASFTSTDRDTSDSSSRDSNGSSQDCFQEHHFADSKGTSFFHNREVFSTHSTGHARERAAGGISTWLRPPFKWKVLFGNAKKQRPDDISSEPKAHSMEGTDRMEFPTSPVAVDRYYSDCSGELTPSGNLHLSSRGAFIHSHGDMDKNPRHGMEKARGYLQRYMKALNPSRSKSDHHSGHVDEAPPRHSPTIVASRSFPPFSQSFRISPKDISLKVNSKRPPPASPGPPRRVSTSSASSELHSAIQGAIAHCKESQKQCQLPDDNVQAAVANCAQKLAATN